MNDYLDLPSLTHFYGGCSTFNSVVDIVLEGVTWMC